MAYREDSFYINRVLNHSDAPAFAMLVNKHKTMAFNIAIRITKSREDAEEVAQDAFIKVYHSLNQFKGESKFTTWLFRVVYNLSLSKIRKKSLVSGSLDDDGFMEMYPETSFEELTRFHEKDQKKFLLQAISRLDEIDQLLITLYYMNDNSIDEISEITGITASNAKVRLFRARKTLHSTLVLNLKDELQSIL